MPRVMARNSAGQLVRGRAANGAALAAMDAASACAEGCGCDGGIDPPGLCSPFVDPATGELRPGAGIEIDLTVDDLLTVIRSGQTFLSRLTGSGAFTATPANADSVAFSPSGVVYGYASRFRPVAEQTVIGSFLLEENDEDPIPYDLIVEYVNATYRGPTRGLRVVAALYARCVAEAGENASGDFEVVVGMNVGSALTPTRWTVTRRRLCHNAQGAVDPFCIFPCPFLTALSVGNAAGTLSGTGDHTLNLIGRTGTLRSRASATANLLGYDAAECVFPDPVPAQECDASEQPPPEPPPPVDPPPEPPVVNPTCCDPPSPSGWAFFSTTTHGHAFSWNIERYNAAGLLRQRWSGQFSLELNAPALQSDCRGSQSGFVQNGGSALGTAGRYDFPTNGGPAVFAPNRVTVTAAMGEDGAFAAGSQILLEVRDGQSTNSPLVFSVRLKADGTLTVDGTPLIVSNPQQTIANNAASPNTGVPFWVNHGWLLRTPGAIVQNYQVELGHSVFAKTYGRCDAIVQNEANQAMDPAVRAAFLRQLGGCAGCGDPGAQDLA